MAKYIIEIEDVPSMLDTPEQDAVIREMRAQGKTWREIADHLGRSRDAIRHRAKIIS